MSFTCFMPYRFGLESHCASSLQENGGAPHGPHQAPRVWILTIDSHHARVFEKHGEKLALIAEMSKGGRLELTAEAGKRTLHADENLTGHPGHDLQFKNLADWLGLVTKDNSFDHLILVAPPKLLGDMRKILPHAVQTRIVAEINKDLAGFNAEALRKELDKIVWF